MRHAALHFWRVAGDAVIFQRNAWRQDKPVIGNLATVAEIDNLVGCIHRCRPLMDNINATIRGETIIVMAYGAVVSEAAKIQVGEEAGVVALRRLN